MTRSQALVALGFAEGDKPLPRSVKDAYYHAARRHHPDKGGGADEFCNVKDAYDKLQAVGCLNCGGTGRISHTSGFTTVAMQCPCKLC